MDGPIYQRGMVHIGSHGGLGWEGREGRTSKTRPDQTEIVVHIPALPWQTFRDEGTDELDNVAVRDYGDGSVRLRWACLSRGVILIQ